MDSEKPNSEKSRKLNIRIMCFGNNENQRNYLPQFNNYCGGFALDAVLTDLGMPTSGPQDTYDQILDKQTGKMCPDSNSAKFILEKEINNTLMLLPSSIAMEAGNRGLETKVQYAPSVKSCFGDIMDEEVTKLGNIAMEMNEDDFWDEVNLNAADSIYFIVLVSGCHWVAVKKIDENNFICYDPADGACTKEMSNIPEVIESAGYNNIDSLVIVLKS